MLCYKEERGTSEKKGHGGKKCKVILKMLYKKQYNLKIGKRQLLVWVEKKWGKGNT